MELKNIIILSVYSVKPGRTYKDALLFMRKLTGEDSLFEDKYERTSFIRKFNNAYGYKQAIGEICVNELVNYQAPDGLLRTNITFLNKENELCSFIIPNKKMEHIKEKYSYDTLEMLLQFQNFLYKVFNEIRIEIKLETEFDLSLKDFALGHFMSCFSYLEQVETEFSTEKMLKEKEVKYIEEIISQVVSFEPVLTQFYCKTCAEHNPKKPYHIQIDRKDLLEKDEREELEEQMKRKMIG